MVLWWTGFLLCFLLPDYSSPILLQTDWPIIGSSSLPVVLLSLHFSSLAKETSRGDNGVVANKEL